MRIDLKTILEEKVREFGSKKAVADELGVSRTAISLYLSGQYAECGGRVDRLEAKIIDRFCDHVLCPHLNADLSRSHCARQRNTPMPQSDPAALRFWIACQKCPLNTQRHSNQDVTAC